MVNTSADDVDTMVYDQPMVLREHGQVMCEHTARPQHPVSARLIQTTEPRPPPQTPASYLLSGLEDLGFVMTETPCTAVPNLRIAQGAGNTSDVDVDQQLLTEWAGGDSLHNVHLPKIPPADITLLEAQPDGSVGEEWTSSHISDEAMVVAFGLGPDSCLVRFLCFNLFTSGIELYTCH